MRGGPEETRQFFSYVDIEDRIAADHPLRSVRSLVEQVLEELSREFAKLYSHTGRPSIPPEHLLKASLLHGRIHGLHPDDPWDGARHDAVLEACEDLRQRLSATSRMADATEKKATRQALAADFIPRWAQGIEGLIGQGPFVGGAQPVVADIKIHMIEKALSGGTYDDIPTTVLDPFARLQSVARGITGHPAVLAWYAPRT